MMGSLASMLVVMQSQAAPSVLVQLFPIILIFGIFYLLVIAPSRKRQKALQETIDALKKGDRVITTGGIYGDVVSVDGSVVILRIAENVRVKLAKSAITGLEKDAGKEKA